jgi:hypothetical protein
MQDSDTITKPYKVGIGIAWTHEGEDEPYRYSGGEQWFEADGTEIHDPARIAELEAQVKAREQCP